MLNNNFYKAIDNKISDAHNFTNSIVKMDGSQLNSTPYRYPYDFNNITYVSTPGALSSTNNKAIFIGSGTTPPTLDDYKLENLITTGYSATISGTNSEDQIVATGQFAMTITITNTQTENLVINELGYFVCGPILYDRIVLDTPVTIAPGATKTIEYRLNMPQP